MYGALVRRLVRQVFQQVNEHDHVWVTGGPWRTVAVARFLDHEAARGVTEAAADPITN